MSLPTSLLALGLVLAVMVAPQPADAQANSYLGLWGRVFDEHSSSVPSPSPPSPSPGNHATSHLAERLRGAAEEWRAEAEELRSRLMQRLSSGSSGDSAAAAGMHLNGENPPKPESSTAETASLLDRLHEALPLEGDMEPRHLAALAALGLLAARRHSAGAMAAATLPSLSTPDSDGPALPRLPGLSEVGVVLPEAMAGPRFEPRLCARLQNFGNAPGYRSLYLGAAPCASHANASAATVGWGQGASEAAFTLECSHAHKMHPQTHQETVGMQGLRAAAAQVASQLGTALQQRQGGLTCSLSVATTNNTGSLVHYQLTNPDPAPAFGLGPPPPRLSALRLRACNLPPSSLQAPARLRANHTALEVRGMKLNGRKVAGTALSAAQVAAGSGRECQAALIRLPPRALADGFVLTGKLALEGGAGTWGVGEMASVDLQLGSLSLLGSTTAADAAGAG